MAKAILGGCQEVEVSGDGGISVPPVRIAPGMEVDLERVVPATKRWKIVFVSQDGPKGHDEIAVEDCGGVVWCSMWQAAQEMGQALGVEMELAYVKEDCTDDAQCVSQQIRLIDRLIKRGGIDGIMIGPRDSNLLVPVIETAIANHITVIALGTPINSPQVLTAVTANNFAGSQSISQWVANRLQGDGNVMIIEGPKYQKNALDRRHGFIAGLQGTNINLLDTETALWTCTKAKTITEKWLAKYPKIDAIIAASDHMALGALIATTQAQRTHILITGYDAIPLAKAAITDGALAATVEQNPQEISLTAVKLMVRHLETGETFAPVISLPTVDLILKANLVDDDAIPPGPDFDPQTLTCNF